MKPKNKIYKTVIINFKEVTFKMVGGAEASLKHSRSRAF